MSCSRTSTSVTTLPKEVSGPSLWAAPLTLTPTRDEHPERAAKAWEDYETRLQRAGYRHLDLFSEVNVRPIGVFAFRWLLRPYKPGETTHLEAFARPSANL